MRALCVAAVLGGLFTFVSCNEASEPPTNEGGGGGGSSASGGTTSTTGGQGGEGGTPSGTGGSTAPSYPESLSATGLYEADMETLAEGVREFTPRFALWSDDAAKARWIQLPEGAQIDTSDPDYWVFPAGTRIWKEFTRDDVRVETRLLEKRENGTWWRIAYQWNEEQTEALPVPNGLADASGTDHDIPSRDQCSGCHGKTRGEVLGFSAIQLAHDGAGLTLDELNLEGLLTEEVTVPDIPGTELDRDAVGYLHANCGTCHNPTSSVQTRVDMDMRLNLAALEAGTVAMLPAYQTTANVEIALTEGSEPPGATLRMHPGYPATSALFLRLNSRGEAYSMPPLGTEEIDTTGRDLIEDWIISLNPD